MEESILKEAERIIEERGEEYGEAKDCFQKIAALWSIYMKIDYSEHDVAIMMCLLKIARANTGVKNRDNYVDIAGYAALAGDL